jgi:2-phospho-L-lactate guanylyltransferase
VAGSGVGDLTLVVIPVKDFSTAKSRLHDALSRVDRELFARRCAGRVAAAAGASPVLVVTDSPDVVAWAQNADIDVVRQRREGLNGAARDGRDEARRRGYARIAIVHADLPRARSLDDILTLAHDVVIVTDHHGTGTNVLVVNCDVPFDFAYGHDSGTVHAQRARELGLDVACIEHPELSFDVDDADDYAQMMNRDTSDTDARFPDSSDK